MDDFDLFKEKMLGSGEKKPHQYRRALLFVDNSGADVILGMLPLARELLRRGTEVNISYFNSFLYSEETDDWLGYIVVIHS